MIVIGAGLTGLSVAYFFKKENAKARVLVLERGLYPTGASTRNAGFACIGTVGEHLADLRIESKEKLGNRIKNRYEGLLLLRETLNDNFIDYVESGGWEIFPEQNEFLKVKDEISSMNSWMENLLGIKEMYQPKTYRGIPSIFNRTEGMLHPGKMIQRLIGLNIQCGVEFRWNTAVSKLDPDSNTVRIDESVTFRSELIAVTSNGFIQELIPEISISPGRGYAFVTNEIDELDWKGTFHCDEGYVYFRNVGENRILLGGGRNVDYNTEQTSEFGVNQNIKNYLVNFVNEVLKLPGYWNIDYEWSGIMGFTRSKSPILKKAGKKCLVVAGLSGMGVALGMQLGKSAAQEMNSL